MDAVFVSKNENADLSVMEGSDLDREESDLLGIMARAIFGYGTAGDEGIEEGLHAAGEGVFGLSDDDLFEIADKIPIGSSALFVLLEHVWALGLREAVASSEGRVVAHGLIDIARLLAIGVDSTDSVL